MNVSRGTTKCFFHVLKTLLEQHTKKTAAHQLTSYFAQWISKLETSLQLYFNVDPDTYMFAEVVSDFFQLF